MEGASALRAERREFSKEDLLRLLSYLEGELQARDVVIAALKSEKAKQLLYQAKYGRLAGDDPLSALQRDSNLTGADSEPDESTVGQMYETQLSQLERLISVQRRCHSRSKQILAAAERRHTRTLRELDEQKQRSAADAAQGDDLCALLENERSRLRQQLEYEQKENDKLRKEMEKIEKKLLDEKERHKSMVLFLINERKQMLLKMHELRLNSERSSASHESPLLAEMRKELVALRTERDQLRTALSSTRVDMHSLKEVVRSQEEDLALMRNSILAHARSHSNNVRLLGDGSLVVANKGVSGGLSSTKSAGATLPPAASDARHAARSRLSNSSSFPSGDRCQPSKVPLPSTSLPRPATSPISSIPSSPTKKHLSSGTSPSSASVGNSRSTGGGTLTERGRAPGSRRAEKEKRHFAVEPEIEQLGAVIDSMNSKSTKRSASLPRNGAADGEVVQSRTSASPKMGGAAKRSALFKAFGVSGRIDRNASS